MTELTGPQIGYSDNMDAQTAFMKGWKEGQTVERERCARIALQWKTNQGLAIATAVRAGDKP